MTQNKTRKWKWLGVNLCRLIISLTFSFSGIVKLIDPRGTQYKIEDYATLFGASSLVTPLLAISMAIALAMLEFYIGFNMLFGIRRRSTSRLTLLVLSVMTPLTLYLALSDAHMDCGCFGDVVILSNWQTFGKNLLMLFATIVVVKSYRHMTRIILERNQWLLSIYALVFALFLALYNIRNLPVIDFRPYSIGTDLPKAMIEDWEKEPDEMRYADFFIQSQEGEDITQTWLEKSGYKFLLVVPFLESADDGSMERINSLFEYCQSHDYPFLAVTSSGQEAIDRWKDLTGGEYDCAFCDGTVLKTIIRSNPGLMMLHDGVVFNKWSANNLPNVEGMKESLDEVKLGQMQWNSRLRSIYRLLLWFLIPLIAWTLIDRIVVGRIYYRRHKIHKTIHNNN